MAITVMEVLKNLPRTNCGDCGQPTCLAFATQVIKEGEDLNKCPHLSGAGADMGKAVRAQQEAGVGRRRESVAISLEVLQEKVAPLDFAALAEGLGATYGEENGRPYLCLTYFGHRLQVFKDELRYPPGAPADPWDAILLYNYIASRGKEPVAGRWIAYNSLPNSVSKAKTLARLEQKLADHFAGRTAQLKERADRLGASRWRRARTPTSRWPFGRCLKCRCCCRSGTPRARKASPPRPTCCSTLASPTTWTWKPCCSWWNT